MELSGAQADDQVVRTVLAGNPNAFDQLVDRYWARSLRYAWRLLGNRADAEDATQQAFTRAYLGLGGYEPQGKFGAWFYRILVNECRAVARDRSHHDHDDLANVAEPAMQQAKPDSPNDQVTDVDRALTRLEPLLREAFVLRYVEDMSYEQMSQISGAGQSALRMRVKRARDQLRAILGGSDGGGS